jgi:uncharacterized damage-inducible protein DinB
MHVYNRWADVRIFEAMAGMSAEDLAAPAPVAFDNLRGALWHSLGAQMGWLGTCAGYDTWARARVTNTESVEGIQALFELSHTLWEEYLDGLDEDGVEQPAELRLDEPFRTSAGAELVKWSEQRGHRPRRPVWQSILHVVNHATQHRGEIGIHLAALGRSPGDLDYGTFEEYRAISDDWRTIRWQ